MYIDEEKLEESLYKLQYKYMDSYGKTEKSQVFHSSEENRVSVVLDFIARLMLENEKKIGNLEAKVYAYEKIIANSNFASLIKEEKR
jgi:hypothetical protein